jgi:hypothetical protein
VNGTANRVTGPYMKAVKKAVTERKKGAKERQRRAVTASANKCILIHRRDE